MINIKNVGSSTVVSISINGYGVEFTRNDGTDFHSDLVARRATELLAGKLGRIRREAYEQGYKDGKGKKRKNEFLSNWWN